MQAMAGAVEGKTCAAAWQETQARLCKKGAALDCLYRGPCLPDLLVPLLACGWLPVLILHPTLDVRYALYGEIGLCLVGIAALVAARKRSALFELLE